MGHQFLSINSINFAKKSLHGFVELTVFPLRPDLKKVRLNCKQCKLFAVLVNDTHEVVVAVVTFVVVVAVLSRVKPTRRSMTP